MTTPSTATAVPQPRVLQAAQAGDQDAFGRLVEPYQGELLAHCYPLSGTWRWRHVGTSSNGQPAIGAYTWREDQGCFLPFALDVLTLEADRIKEVTAFITRSAVERDREAFVRYADEPIDARKVAAVFERAGLPGRLD